MISRGPGILHVGPNRHHSIRANFRTALRILYYRMLFLDSDDSSVDAQLIDQMISTELPHPAMNADRSLADIE